MINEMVIDENNVGFVPSLGISFQLNETAKNIIDFLKEGKSKEEIIKIISESEGEDWKQVYIDVEDFFLKLKLYGIIK